MKKVIFRVSVGNLVTQMLSSGDINFRFTARGSAVDGIRGHQRIQRGRPGDYQAEITIKGEEYREDLCIEVRGRIDGVYSDNGEVILEEIKTIRIPFADIPEATTRLHWAQAKVYAHLYSRENDLTHLTVQLCYLNLETNEITALREDCDASHLKEFYTDLIDTYLAWLLRHSAWQQARDRSIDDLEFPYATYRPGQRELAVAAYRTCSGGGQVLVQAPTGIGKTLATLFPAIKAVAEACHEQVFYLTAKGSGRSVVEESLKTLEDKGLRYKSITITAKDKICFSPGSSCEPDQCTYAKGHYDRIREGILDTLENSDRLTREVVEAKAREHHLCPFELSLDLASWADCVICDYNYVFDPAVYLRRFFDDNLGQYCFLVDEAHNLVDRGRDMFSATLSKQSLMALKRSIKSTAPQIVRKLEQVNRAILDLKREGAESLDEFGYHVQEQLPDKLCRSVREFCLRAEAWLSDHPNSGPDDPLLQFYFDCLRFLRTADGFNSSYATLVQKRANRRRGNLDVTLYCIDPSDFLRQGFARANTSILFSATLTPVEYYRSLLGVDRETDLIRMASPFPAENLATYVARRVATTYRKRASSYASVVDLIGSVIDGATGNYLVYFPSYRYMEEVRRRFEERRPDVDVVVQQASMTEPERDAFLDRLIPAPASTLVGFAVLGGIFAEAIDLGGSRLIGVVIVTVGLPQLGIERDLIMNHFSDLGMGFEFAYQYPGMTRVLQTAGRVIRSESDRGIICLIDERYGQHRYRDLFPGEWSPVFVDTPGDLSHSIKDFWQQWHEVSDDA